MDDYVLIIGTADECDIRVVDEYASTRHAKLTIRPDYSIWIEDLGSTNGTLLDRKRIYGPTRVGLDVVVRVGRTNLSLQEMLIAATRMNRKRADEKKE